MTTAFRFFDLPGELRSAILSHLLVSDLGFVLHNQTLLRLPLCGSPTVLRLFLVNLQMYQEASAIFYSQNRFIMNAQSHRLPVHLTSPGGFLSPQAQDARRRVRDLKLLLTRVGGEFEDVLGPAISDMVLCGNLRELRFRIGPPSGLHPSTRVADSDFVQRTPFQALLTLLADPDLDVVEMEVWKVHWSVLCPFHRTEDPLAERGNLSNESVDGLGFATARDGPDWIQLDCRTMANTLGTGQQVVRIGERAR